MEISNKMSNKLLINENYSTVDSFNTTAGNSQTETPSNLGIYTVRSLEDTSLSNNDINKTYNITDDSNITNYDILKLYLNELLIRFDVSPKYYKN